MLNTRQVSREEAGRLIRAAHQLDPSHQETARRLARYLFTTDALEELVGAFEPLLDTPHPDPQCLHHLGLAASVLGDHELAEAALSLAVAGGHADSRGPWARALRDLRRTSEAYSIAMQTLQQSPEDDWAAQVACNILLAEGRQSELWSLCPQLREGGRWTPRVVSALSHAAQTQEQVAFVQRLTDKDVWMEQRALGVEPAWLQQLSASLDASDHWTTLPRAKATVGSGRRIEAVHAVTCNPWLDSIFQQLQAAVEDYVEKRKDLFALPPEDQPMAAMRPDHPTLVGWVVSVNGEGHEDWHIHPDGWLSGVFYIEVPNPETTDLEIPDQLASETPYAGQIEFGPLPMQTPAPVTAWPGWKLEPRAGDLLLFPSYFAHRTWPTHLAKNRICIAFDVLRRGIDGSMAATAPGCERSRPGLDDRIARNGAAVSVPDDRGWQIIMNLDTGRCVAMDDTGALVWTLLQTPRTARQMASTLAREFEGPETEIQRDVANVLAHLVTWGLAVIV